MKTVNERRSDTKQRGKINWVVFIAFIVMITLFSCLSIFYFKIFEKWDRAEIIYAEEVDGKPYSCIVHYKVNEVEYKNGVSYQTTGGHPLAGPQNPGEFYIEYLVNDPNYIMVTRTTPCIIFTVVDVFLIIIFAPVMIWWSKSKQKKNA